MTAHLTDGQFAAAFFVGCICLTMLAVLFALGLCRAAARPAPRRETDPEGIVRAEYEAAS